MILRKHHEIYEDSTHGWCTTKKFPFEILAKDVEGYVKLRVKIKNLLTGEEYPCTVNDGVCSYLEFHDTRESVLDTYAEYMV